MNNIQSKSFQLCSEKKLSELTRELYSQFQNEIDQESDDYIVNVDEERFLEYLVGKYSINTPYLDFNNIKANTGKTIILGENFPYPMALNVQRGKKYERPTIIYYVPCTGDTNLLRYQTNTIYSPCPTVFIDDGCLCFDFVNFHNDLERIKNHAPRVINDIKTIHSNLIKEIENFNYNLRHNIRNKIQARKSTIESIIQILGVPIKKRSNLSDSYIIPDAQSKVNISLKPQISSENSGIEYTLEDAIYTDILQVIHDYGKGFEQYPSISKDKEEEEIRDHFLFVLQPRYNWAATGEAFNKLGKTDILIKYEKAIVFIAECKFWHGQKAYLTTISQLFDRYLTWRNSKAAVVIFVENKDFSSVVNEVKTMTSNHPNFVRFVDEKEETWINYIFHINENPSREVKLAVLLFHIPTKKKESI